MDENKTKFEIKKMHTADINKFMGMVLEELAKAEGKHPKFCDEVIPPGFDFDEEEKRWKKWNDEATTYYASDIFNEEFYEALNAYQQGEKEHALQELAQCGAVILRIMETIEKEIFDAMLNSVGTAKDLCKIVEEKIDKHQFKICEAVALGLTHYYMGPRDKREVTATERAEALATIPDLPEGWMRQKHEWDACIH